MRHLTRARDENEPAIVRTLRARGFYVLPLEPPAPDLLVQDRSGRWHVLEVKNPTTQPSRGRKKNPQGLTPSQSREAAKMHRPAPIVETPADALRALEDA